MISFRAPAIRWCRRRGAASRIPARLAAQASRRVAEGSAASGTSKKTELKLIGVARASLEELLLDYEDFLRQRSLARWEKDSDEARAVRGLAYRSNKSHKTYLSYFDNAESAANAMICLINQANFLLDRQLRALGQQFLKEGGFTERLYNERKKFRGF